MLISSKAGIVNKYGKLPKTSSHHSIRKPNDDKYTEMLRNLKAFKKNRPFRLLEDDIRSLIATAREVLMNDPMLLEVSVPLRVVGDIHGQYTDLLQILNNCGFPPQTKYLFLGDYVDRGKNSVETLTLLLLLKVKFPKKVFLLRGNHESQFINRIYGFYDECKRRYSTKLWKNFVDCYNCLPMAAIISNRIFCCHGGISRNLTELDEIKGLPRPAEVPDEGLFCDLLWADPDPYNFGWSPSDRGVSFLFGRDVLEKFLAKHDFDLVCRAHQVVEDGYEFFAKRQLVTLFSAPNYCGLYDNAGATMGVDENLTITFDILHPSPQHKLSLRETPNYITELEQRRKISKL